MRYFDAHTHSLEPNPEVFSIYNLDASADLPEPIEHPFCAGIHPWWIQSHSPQQVIPWLEKCLQSPYCMGIGEIGFDRYIPIPFNLQKEWFDLQWNFSLEHEVRLIVLHAVRATADLLPYLRDKKFKGIFLFHDFQGPKDFISQAPEHVFFSVGPRGLKKKNFISEVLPLIPSDRLLGETDDSGESIKSVYAQLKIQPFPPPALPRWPEKLVWN